MNGPAQPYCFTCGTDEFLLFESFAPAADPARPQQDFGQVSYSCSRCREFSGHPVPATWTPPGWHPAPGNRPQQRP